MKNSTRKIISVLLCLCLVLGTGIFSVSADSSDITRVSCTINGDTKTQRGFCWYTPEKTDSVVKIFCGGVDVTSTVSYSFVSCEEWEGSYVHKVTVSGLKAGKSYTYVVGDGSTWSKEGSFTTDNGDDKVDFIAIADVQTGSLENFKKAAEVVDAAREILPDADFIANMGDFTNDSTNEEWDNYFTAFERHNMNLSLAPVAGNHDGFAVWHWFANIFNLDESESVQNLNGVNYSFDYGNAHFAIINTNDLMSVTNAQLKWLKNDMNSSAADWKIVFMHKTPYSLGKDGKWPDALYLSDVLVEVIDECDVDLVVAGHDHMYLRTKPLTDNKVVPYNEGAIYVLTGTAGSKKYEVREFSVNTYFNTDLMETLVIQKNNYGNYWNGTNFDSTDPANIGGAFSTVSIDGGNLTFKAYVLSDETKTLKQIDTFTLTKETGKAQPSFSGDNTTSVFDYAMTVLPSFAGIAGYTLIDWLVKTIINLPKILYFVIKTGTF